MADKQSNDLLGRYANSGSYENPDAKRMSRSKDEIIADLNNSNIKPSKSPFRTPDSEHIAHQYIADLHEKAKQQPRYDTRMTGQEISDFDTLQKIQELSGTQDRKNPNDKSFWGHLKTFVGIKTRK